MPAASYVLGDGTLVVSDADGSNPIELEAQIASARVQWSESVSAGEVIELLSGDQLRDEDTTDYSAVFVANLVQDITVGGSIAYSWTHKGEQKKLTFVPNTGAARQVVGTVTIVPIDLGGDVKKRNRSDISWRFAGDPVLSAVV